MFHRRPAFERLALALRIRLHTEEVVVAKPAPELSTRAPFERRFLFVCFFSDNYLWRCTPDPTTY